MRSFLALIGITLLFACRKDKLGFPIWNSGDTTDGICVGLRNGETWISQGIGTHRRTQTNVKIDSLICFYFVTYEGTSSGDTVVREYMVLGCFPTKIGKYKLSPRMNIVETTPIGEYLLVYNEDISESFKSILDTSGLILPYLEIESIDETTHEVTGNFQATFKFGESGKPYYDLPDKVTFSNTHFKVKLSD